MPRVICILFVFYLKCSMLNAQTNCPYQIDTTRILTNQNLDPFISLLKTDHLKITYKKGAIPQFIKSELDCLANGFRIANPKQPYNATDVIFRNLPRRQLIYSGIGKNLFVIQYYLGGFGKSTNLILIKFDRTKILELWKGFGLDNAMNAEDISNFLETERMKHWGLNTNIIYF